MKRPWVEPTLTELVPKEPTRWLPLPPITVEWGVRMLTVPDGYELVQRPDGIFGVQPK